MPNQSIKFVFSTGRDRSGRGDGISEKERRSHAARVGRHRTIKDANQGDTTSANIVRPPAPRTQAIYRLNVPRKGDQTSKSHSNPTRDGADASILDDEETWLAPPSTLNGNSDPFAMLPIVVTPLVNHVLTFMREALYPNLYFNPFFRRLYGDSHGPINVLQDSSWLPAQTARQGWGFATSSLNSKGQALACIASFLHNMGSLMPESGRLETGRQALILTTKSSQLLRTYLDSTPTIPGRSALAQNPGLITHVFWLFRAAVFSGNKSSVSVHGKILVQSMVQGFRDGVVDHLMIIQAINDDCDDASLNMRRTLFDPDWYCSIVKPLWAMADPILPPIPEAIYKEINQAIEIPDLREVCIGIRHSAAFCEDGFQVPNEAWGPPEHKQLAFAWFVTKSEYAMSKLLQIYFDLREGIWTPTITINEEEAAPAAATAATMPVLSPGQRYTQAGLALGLLYYLRVIGHEALINGRDIRDATPGILPHLRFVLRQISLHATEAEKVKYRDAHAWLYFLGAFAEERKQHLVASRWFQRQLAEHVAKARARGWTTPATSSWESYRLVFRSFLFSDWAQPNGAKWFDRVVGADLRETVILSP